MSGFRVNPLAALLGAVLLFVGGWAESQSVIPRPGRVSQSRMVVREAPAPAPTPALYTVVGEVHLPAVFSSTEQPVALSRLLSAAGGLRPAASRSICLIHHGKKSRIHLDSGAADADIFPGTIIVVSAAGNAGTAATSVNDSGITPIVCIGLISRPVILPLESGISTLDDLLLRLRQPSSLAEHVHVLDPYGRLNVKELASGAILTFDSRYLDRRTLQDVPAPPETVELDVAEAAALARSEQAVAFVPGPVETSRPEQISISEETEFAEAPLPLPLPSGSFIVETAGTRVAEEGIQQVPQKPIPSAPLETPSLLSGLFEPVSSPQGIGEFLQQPDGPLPHGNPPQQRERHADIHTIPLDPILAQDDRPTESHAQLPGESKLFIRDFPLHRPEPAQETIPSVSPIREAAVETAALPVTMDSATAIEETEPTATASLPLIMGIGLMLLTGVASLFLILTRWRREQQESALAELMSARRERSALIAELDSPVQSLLDRSIPIMEEPTPVQKLWPLHGRAIGHRRIILNSAHESVPAPHFHRSQPAPAEKVRVASTREQEAELRRVFRTDQRAEQPVDVAPLEPLLDERDAIPPSASAGRKPLVTNPVPPAAVSSTDSFRIRPDVETPPAVPASAPLSSQLEPPAAAVTATPQTAPENELDIVQPEWNRESQPARSPLERVLRTLAAEKTP